MAKGRALREIRELVLDGDAPIDLRRSALEALVRQGGEDLERICTPMLRDPRVNVVAARGMAQQSSTSAAKALIANYRRFRSPHRPEVIGILCSRVPFARELMAAIANKKISADSLTAYDVRQLHSLEDAAISRQVSQLWGEVRATPEDRRRRIEDWKSRLTAESLASADLRLGRKLFQKTMYAMSSSVRRRQGTLDRT